MADDEINEDDDFDGEAGDDFEDEPEPELAEEEELDEEIADEEETVDFVDEEFERRRGGGASGSRSPGTQEGGRHQDQEVGRRRRGRGRGRGRRRRRRRGRPRRHPQGPHRGPARGRETTRTRSPRSTTAATAAAASSRRRPTSSCASRASSSSIGASWPTRTRCSASTASEPRRLRGSDTWPSDEDDRTPIEQLVEQAADLFVYAPIGLFFEGPTLLPKLAEQGRGPRPQRADVRPVRGAPWRGRGTASGRRRRAAGRRGAAHLRAAARRAADPTAASRHRRPTDALVDDLGARVSGNGHAPEPRGRPPVRGSTSSPSPGTTACRHRRWSPGSTGSRPPSSRPSAPTSRPTVVGRRSSTRSPSSSRDITERAPAAP